MEAILNKIREESAFAQFEGELNTGTPTVKLGLMRAARLPVLAALAEKQPRVILLLTQRRDRSLAYFEELNLWSPELERLFFPEPSALFYENAPSSETARRERLSVLARLAHANGAKPLVVVASGRAIMTRTLPKENFVGASLRIDQGTRHEPLSLAHKLVRMGYESTSSVTAPGHFARRGGILDLWAMQDELPSRLEFFGDEIESLRQFDPASQRTIMEVNEVLVSPAREYLLGLETKLGIDPKDLNEFHTPLLHPDSVSLLDYLPDDAIICIDDQDALHEQITELETQAITLRKDAMSAGVINKDYSIPYLPLDEIEDEFAQRQIVELGPADLLEEAKGLARLFRPGPRFGGQLKPMLDHVEHMLENGNEVILVSRQAARLQDLWAERSFESSKVREPKFKEGSLGDGWVFSPTANPALHLLSDGEIFGWERPQPRRQPRVESEAPETPYVDLQNDELVVHIDHGIGLFKGLIEAKVEGVPREYLRVEYAGGDQLYVPVHQADRLTRYVGGRADVPSLSRLGGTEWRGTKSRVKRAVEAVAEDLLELYARREMAEGHAYPPDTPWQRELEASFPYIETEDQLRVLAEVKRDMETSRPMDRLVCGDAGYGKTEVALRSAFKAVIDGKQVALLVPTTVLAQQHYETFRQRLAAFPVKLDMLSRFRNSHEQGEIIKKLANGGLDIVIGTHRLVQKDVKFKDLGLLIIDEEQRFGVTHKEFLKKMRTEVDVLTMTATPIPRTLYMALTGVRDISTINTPPEERLPVVTHVGPYSERLVRQAVLRELDRGGQIFFVHNRVHTIDGMRRQIQRLVPEVRLAVAHGQMAERDLAKRMMEFSAGEIDLLLTTTIIESGLDIPNANTLIVDRADAFGLAQLYQLRGRVGRGAQRAYAYFFRHPQRGITQESRQRLDTIAENTQLGAGFSVAMRDLEIRGAGEMLGTRQHGLIAAVGFHLYTRLLTKAVSDLKRSGRLAPSMAAAQASLYHPIINVDLPIEVGIPSNYVADKGMRLKLYRRLADLHDLQEIDALQEEFKDRFGEPPEEIKNLLYQLKVRVLAERAGVVSISVENKQLALRLPTRKPHEEPRYYPDLGTGVRTSKNTVWMTGLDGNHWQEHLLTVLERLKVIDK